MSGLRFAALALARLAIVLVSVMAATWLVMRALRPDLFRGDPDPVPVALGRFLDRTFLHFDFGSSGFGGRDVNEMLARGLPADLSLLLGGLALGVLGGFAAGAWCAARPRARSARVLESVATGFLCAPVNLVAAMALLLFGAKIGAVDGLRLVPLEYVPFADSPLRWVRALLVPWLILAMPLAAMLLRAMRTSLHGVLDEDAIRTAHGKGLAPARVMRRHAVPLAAAPVLSLLSATTTVIVVNLVLIEQVFSIPGVFNDLRRTLAAMDLPVFFGLTFVAAAYSALMSLVLDLTLARLDPQVRHG